MPMPMGIPQPYGRSGLFAARPLPYIPPVPYRGFGRGRRVNNRYPIRNQGYDSEDDEEDEQHNDMQNQKVDSLLTKKNLELIEDQHK
jgi:hypothetical protein